MSEIPAFIKFKGAYKGNQSTKDAPGVKVPVMILEMGTRRFGAGGRSINSAVRKIIEVFEKKKSLTQAHIEEARGRVLEASKEFLESIKYGSNKSISIFSQDEHTLEWMKFGVSSISEAIAKYKARRKELRKQFKGNKDKLVLFGLVESKSKRVKRASAQAKNKYTSLNPKNKKNNLFRMMGRLIHGEVPYAKSNPTYMNLPHKHKEMYHIQASGGTGMSNKGDTIFRSINVVYDETRNTYKLMVSNKNAAKVFNWLDKGTTKSGGAGSMIGRGNVKKALRKEIKSNFIPKQAIPIVEKYFKRLRLKK